jgi:hypothetical protein
MGERRNPSLVALFLDRARHIDNIEARIYSMDDLTSVRLKREQIQLVALDVVDGFVFDTGNRLTEQHFFEERH